MKIIYSTLGGSHAYGLNTPASDLDARGCFLNEEPEKIIGLQRFDHQDIKKENDDTFLFELRHFLSSLRKTNTQALELLFTDEAPNFKPSPEWALILTHKFSLLDSKHLYKSLKGYMFGERRLMNGERTGLLGSKRHKAVEEFGYSFKNAVQLFRLAWAGKYFFTDGIFPVNVKKYNPDFAARLIDIKTNPANYKKEDLNKQVDEAEKELDKAFEKRTITYCFDEKVATEICIKLYLPFLIKYDPR